MKLYRWRFRRSCRTCSSRGHLKFAADSFGFLHDCYRAASPRPSIEDSVPWWMVSTAMATVVAAATSSVIEPLPVFILASSIELGIPGLPEYDRPCSGNNLYVIKVKFGSL